MAPKGFYVVINTAGNRVVLHNGDKTEAEMIASCGSGNVLEDPKGGRRWTFDTPRGVFSVKTKVADPVWIKPDWAFIEEGEPIPKDRSLRAEPGMMGDYAIGIGDGYYLHGTLYSRLLGRNVSHGCVRLGDADIDKLFHTLSKGDRVYIF
ncbi:MAG: L,D-transpeptidase [Desulfobulbaceae bacterium]|nr:L,D-transpeptidase [Desulfobulbaceae bacterium]